jgi:signal transduction histidine kinase
MTPVKNVLRILLVEDSTDDAVFIEQALRHAGMATTFKRVDSRASMAKALAQDAWDLVLSDYFLPGFSGVEALQQLRAYSADIPFIIVSGRIDEQEAVALMKSGADDYVRKDNLARLAPVLQRSLDDAQNRLASRRHQIALRESEARYKAIVSNLPGMAFEMQFSPDGNLSFVSVSHGCGELLQVEPDELLLNPEAFIHCIVSDDLPLFRLSLRSAFMKSADWNWDGRIRNAASGEIKWVSLRSRSHKREDRRQFGSQADASADRRSKSRRGPEQRMCWHGIVLDITQSKTADLKIRRAHEELARLSAHVETVKERERGHLSREIHDELGGTLTAIKIMLMRLGQELTSATPDATKAQQRLLDAETLLEFTMEITRRIATSLRPAILDLGIVAAIEWQAAEFQKRMDINCQVTCTSKDIALDHHLAIVLFRTFQEALTNIAKHAGATRVEVEIEADEDNISLQVHDNGRGIASEDLIKAQSYGILGMRERARSLGGEASVRRTRAGTAVMLRVPRTVQTTDLGTT